jgi:ribonuclease P protein component
MKLKRPAIIKAGVGVGKRHFKKAVHRNRIKRLLREAYRLNKQLLHENCQQKQISLFILFTDKELPTFETINAKMQQLLNTLQKKLHEVA